MSKDFKFVFFGTPYVASKTLEILKESGYLPSLIITSPDKPKGRKLILTPSSVKTWAIENDIPYLAPEKIDLEFIEKLKETTWDIFIVVAYGKILPENLINIPKKGSINIHYSLLPKWRGASPVESSILNGDSVTGVTIQEIAKRMDTGDILIQEEITIGKDEKTEELKERLIELGGNLLVKNISKILSGEIKKITQDENLASYCKKIKKEDGEVFLEKETGKDLYNKFRAYHVWPRIFFFKGDKRIIITEAKLENEEFKIEKVLPEGKKEVSFDIWKNSNL